MNSQNSSNNNTTLSISRRRHLLSAALILTSARTSAFAPQTCILKSSSSTTQLYHWANRLDNRLEEPTFVATELPNLQPLSKTFTRRSLLSIGVASTTLTTLLSPLIANADLMDREVSIFYGNKHASPSRRNDNSNVLFSQDNYFKFGAAAQWTETDSTDFPKKMPFVLSQQRYDGLKKYRSKVDIAKSSLLKLGSITSAEDVPLSDDPSYQLRAMGLLANSFLASENTGVSNELMLARWYVNEIYLRIGDYRRALISGDDEDAKFSYQCMIKAMNSYLTLLNRSITSKVGDPFTYVE